MIAPLIPAAVATLQQALAAVRSDPAAAERLVRALPAAARAHPDALFVLASALRGQGRGAEARPLLAAAAAAAPRNGRLWNSFGNCLADLGEVEPALAAFDRALAIDPRDLEAAINLGIVATRFGRLDVAAAALARALAIRPGDARALGALGVLEQARGDQAAAAAAYQRALAANPGDHGTQHNLATAWRALDRPEAALAALDAALASGRTAADTATVRGHVLAELGQFEAAIGQYRAVLAQTPDALDAHDALVRLLPQLGRRDEALDSYAAALAAAPANPALWGAAIAAAKAVDAPETMLRWAAEAQAVHGATPDLRLAQVAALTRLGAHHDALAQARALAAEYPGMAAAQLHLAHLLIAGGDPAQAEAPALRATELTPLDQSGWALLTVIWRLTGDPREAWLADYQRLVVPVDLEAPAGYDRDAFIAAAAQALGRLHLARAHPADQSLRGGTQTAGNLFDRTDPLLQALAASVRAATEAALAALPADPSHPFLARNTGRIAFAGSWSVRLRREGFHIAHIHPSGWLSSALHIAVPPEIGGGGDAGKLLFGVPDAALGLDLPPRRVVAPVPGRLVLFPSYFWHGTAPFDSAEPRLTVAFDALPQ